MSPLEIAIQGLRDNPGMFRKELAAKVGVSYTTVKRAVRVLDGQLPEPVIVRLTNEQEDKIVAMKASGSSYKQIGEEFGCCLSTARKRYLDIARKRGVSIGEKPASNLRWPALSPYVRPVPLFAR